MKTPKLIEYYLINFAQCADVLLSAHDAQLSVKSEAIYMTFKIEINCDNAAFEACLSYELTRILFKVTRLIEQEMIAELDNYPLMDVNGNKVGTIKIIK